MRARRRHRHWVTAIETRPGDPYGGIRLMVHHDRAAAWADLKEWIEDELQEGFETAELAVAAYTERRRKSVVVEEQDV